MRITVVEPVAKGGLIHYAFQLCRALAAAGAEVELVTGRDFELARLPRTFALAQPFRLWDPKPARDRLPALLRQPRRLLRGARYGWAWLRVAAHLARTRPDWVQLGDCRFALDLGGVLLLRALGLRVADVCHNVEPLAAAGARAGRFGAARGERRRFRALYRRMAPVFVHYEENRRRFLALWQVAPERVVAIPHGDESLFRELAEPGLDAQALRARLDLPAAAPVVLFFGTLSRYKGVEVLVDAFARVAAARAEPRLVIAGFPTPEFDLAGLRAHIAGLGLDGRVRLLAEYVPSGAVAAWMQLAAVAVFPYHEVSQSGALLVAQSFGVPVVASAVGGFRAAVRDGETGLLVPPGDTGALAGALARMLEQPGPARLLAECAEREVRENASWAVVARQVLAEYRARADGRAAAPAREARP